MSIKPCPPCCAPALTSITVPDNFLQLTKQEQRSLLVSILNDHPEWQQTINLLIQFIDDGNHISSAN
jgi:hypothetical protein